jgi:hypothetical protein
LCSDASVPQMSALVEDRNPVPRLPGPPRRPRKIFSTASAAEETASAAASVNLEVAALALVMSVYVVRSVRMFCMSYQ